MRRSLPSLLMAGLAILVRIPNLGWGLPRVEEEALPMKMAFAMWGWEGSGIELDPATVGWPSLSFYIHLVAQRAYYIFGRWVGRFDDPYDYLVEFLVDPAPTVLLGRLLGVLAAAGTVYLAARLGQRLAGWSGALLSGGILAVSPLLVEQSHRIHPDILLSFFFALAVYAIVAIQSRGHRGDYVWAGIAIGLGTACKYTPVLLLPSLIAVHLLRTRQEHRPLGLAAFKDSRLWLSFLAFAGAFVAASPYTLSSLVILNRDFGYQLTHMTEAHFGQSGRGPAWVYYVREVLGPGIGWPAFVLSSWGLVAATWRWRGPWLALLLCAAPYYLVMGGLSTSFPRYALPLLFPLAMGLTGALLVLRDWLAGATGQSRVLFPAVALVALVPAAIGTAQYERFIARTSTQLLAEREVRSRLADPLAPLAVESYTVELPDDAFLEEARTDELFLHLTDAQEARLLDRTFYPYVVIPLYSLKADYASFYYDLRLYRPYQYLMTSSAVKGRYEAEPRRFPAQMEFYRELDRYGNQVWSAGPTDSTRGPALSLVRMDSTSWARLEAERGPIPRGFHLDFLERFDPARFQSFFLSLGRHAYDQGLHEQAELYYQALYDSLDEPRRLRLLRRLAFLKMQVERWDEADLLFGRWLLDNPRDPEVLVNQGWVSQNRGLWKQARAYYDSTLAVDPDGAPAAWAAQRLAELDEAESEP